MNSTQTTALSSSARYPLNEDKLDENGYPLQEAVDIHRLDLRFQDTRIERPKALARLTQSIAEIGLRLPVQVADTGNATSIAMVSSGLIC